MENKLIVINADEYGLQKEEAAKIESVFVPMLKKMKELETEYNDIVSKEITPELCSLAKTLRLKYVKVRTGTDEIHKKAKAYYLAGSRFVDGWRNAQKFASIDNEEKLEYIEKHFERIEEEKREKLLQERIEKLSPYVDDTSIYNLKDMSIQGFDQLLNSSILAQKAMKDAEEKAEKERIAQEKKEEKERIRRDKEIEEFRKKTIAREKELEDARKKAEAEKAEAEKQLREKEAAEAKIKAEEDAKKADQERLDKETRYKDFLKENGVNEETKHLYHIEKVEGQIKLYKEIAVFNI